MGIGVKQSLTATVFWLLQVMIIKKHILVNIKIKNYNQEREAFWSSLYP